MMRKTSRVALAALLTLFAAAPAFAEDKVEAKVMKYTDLQKLVKDNKGKVIVVDFWQDFCTVCKKEMPKLIELKKKYGDDLVAITVNLDDLHDPDNPKLKAKNEETLKKLGATNTINVFIDDKQAVWEKGLNVSSFPTVFVFRPDGKYEKRYPEDKENFDYEDVAKDVAALLKKK